MCVVPHERAAGVPPGPGGLHAVMVHTGRAGLAVGAKFGGEVVDWINGQHFLALLWRYQVQPSFLQDTRIVVIGLFVFRLCVSKACRIFQDN